MTEQFNKAASVLLSHRLNNLLRIDENVEIDMNYITCAEYQLFIKEQLNFIEYRYPGHWNDHRFPNGEAKKAVTGVKAIYAEEFCEWLTQRESSLLYKYRLPNLNEAQKYPLEENNLGYWCQDGNTKVIKGINKTKCVEWEKALYDIFINDLNCVSNLDIFFGSNTIAFASKIQILVKSLEAPEIYDFVRKVYNLSSNELENFSMVKILDKLKELNNSIEVMNINNSAITFQPFVSYNHQAIFATLESIKQFIFNKIFANINYLEKEINLALKQLQDLDKSIQERKFYLSLWPIDMTDQLDNIIFVKKTVKLINPITGQDEFIDIPAINYQTTSLEDFKNINFFVKSINAEEKIIQELQKKIIQKRSQFIDIDNSLQKEKALYEKSSYQFPDVVKIFESTEHEYLHLLITCAISIWIEKTDLAREIFVLYLYSILLKERLENRIPAWESIRIVRERL